MTNAVHAIAGKLPSSLSVLQEGKRWMGRATLGNGKGTSLKGQLAKREGRDGDSHHEHGECSSLHDAVLLNMLPALDKEDTFCQTQNTS